MPQDIDPDDRLARDTADRLLGEASGVNLTGPQVRIDRIIARLQTDLDRSRLFPVLFEADQGTPESLRVTVGQAHADRPSFDTGLLLIVPDAGRLSVELLRELELAAEAAAQFGGLKFLLASKAPLRPMLRDAGLHHLFDRLDASMAVRPDTSPDASRLSGSLLPMSATKPVRSSGRTGLGSRLLLAGAILLGLLLVIVVVLDAVRPEHRAAPIPTRPTSPPTESSLPPAAAPTPAPVAPTPPIPAPAGQATPPSNQTPAGPSPSDQAPSTVAPSTLAPPASIPPAQPPASPRSSNLLLVAQPGDTLPLLYAKVYAGSTPPPYAAVVALNPIVRPGTRLIFPAPPGGWHSTP